jgi:hypothetical protein
LKTGDEEMFDLIMMNATGRELTDVFARRAVLAVYGDITPGFVG